MMLTRSAAICFSALLLAAGGVAAQQPGVPGGRAQSPFVNKPAPDEPVIADVNFPGGTIREYTEYLRSVTPNNAANVVLADEVANVVLPAVRLRDVNVTQAVYIIKDVTDNRRTIDVDSTNNSAGSAVFTVRYQRTGNPYQDAPAPIAIYQISDIISGEGKSALATGSMSVNTVLTALEHAMSMVGGTPPEVKYHADSGLLLMKGNPQQLESASQVLNSLRETTGRVNGMGGGKWQRSWTLANVGAQQVVLAFRDVFPAGSEEASAVTVDADESNKVVVSGPKNMAVAADVLVRYIDRPQMPDPQVTMLQTELDAARAQNQQLTAQIARMTQDSIKAQQEMASTAAGAAAQVRLLEGRVKMLSDELEQLKNSQKK